MGAADFFGSGQIGDAARQLEQAVIGARGEVHLLHGGTHQVLAGFIQAAVLADIGVAHVGIAQHARRGFTAQAEALALDLALSPRAAGRWTGKQTRSSDEACKR